VYELAHARARRALGDQALEKRCGPGDRVATVILAEGHPVGEGPSARVPAQELRVFDAAQRPIERAARRKQIRPVGGSGVRDS
jgi:hypothetical protein